VKKLRAANAGIFAEAVKLNARMILSTKKTK